MNFGLDIGYSHVKIVSSDNGQPIGFPSLVGSADRARFAVNGSVEPIILAPTGKEMRAVGEGAILHSRFLTRREDREWISSDEYSYLIAAALTELTTGSPVSLRIVTGLPIQHYSQDKDILKERLLGEHRIDREGRRQQIFRVEWVSVIPQPFGTVMAEGSNKHGQVLPGGVGDGNIGILDIGGKTTNILRVMKLEEVGHDTTSIDVGGWEVVRAVRNYLANTEGLKGLESKRDHEIAEIVRTKTVKAHGVPQDLSKPINDILQEVSSQILAEVTQLWGNGIDLDAILITGGGAIMLGDYITPHYRHARVVQDPVHANARGYFRFSQRLK